MGSSQPNSPLSRQLSGHILRQLTSPLSATHADKEEMTAPAAQQVGMRDKYYGMNEPEPVPFPGLWLLNVEPIVSH